MTHKVFLLFSLILNLECDEYITDEIKELAVTTKKCVSSFIKYLVENKYINITEKYEIYNQKQHILTKNHRNEWYCTYISEKNYLTQIIYDVIQNYSLQLRGIEKILLKFSIIINFVPETHALCLPFLIDLIILNIYYPYIYIIISR